MTSKELILQLIESTLQEYGYAQIAKQLSKEIGSGVDSQDIVSARKENNFMNDFMNELEKGNYSTVMEVIYNAVNKYENKVNIDNGNLALSESDSRSQFILKAFDKSPNPKIEMMIMIYLIRRVMFLENLSLFYQQIIDGSEFTEILSERSKELMDYLREHLMPVLDLLATAINSLDLEEFVFFEHKIVHNLTREKESSLLLPLLLEPPKNQEELLERILNQSIIFFDTSHLVTNNMPITSVLRSILSNTYLSAFFNALEEDKERLRFPPKCLEKCIQNSITYWKEQSRFHLTPRILPRKSKDLDPLFSSLQADDLYRNQFPSSLLMTLSVHTDEVWFAKFSPLGKHLVTGSRDGRLVVYDVANEFSVLVILESSSVKDSQAFVPFSSLPSPNKSKAIIYCCWDPSEQYLVSCCLDTIIRVWYLGDLKKHSKRITRSMDSSNEESVKLLSCFTLGQNIRTWTCEFIPNNDLPRPLFIVGSPDKVLKAFDIDGVELFDFYSSTDQIQENAVNQNNNEDEDVLDDPDKVKNLNKQLPSKKIQNNFNRINDFSITPDGKILITANNDRKVYFYEIPDTFEGNTSTRILSTITLNGRLTSSSISSDGKFLLVSIAPEELQLWDISDVVNNSEKPILSKKFIGHSQSGYIIRSSLGYLVNNEEELALSGSEDGYIYIWQTKTGQLITRIKGHNGLCNSVDWNRFYQPKKNSKDWGKVWCSVGDDKLVKIWGPPEWNN